MNTMNPNTAIHVLVSNFSWHQIGACQIERSFDAASRVLKHFCKKYHNHETSPSCRIFILNLYETPFHTNNSYPFTNKRIIEMRAGCLSKFEREKDISAGVINIWDCHQVPVDSLFKNNVTDFPLKHTTFLRQEPTQAFLATMIRRIHKWLATRH